MYIDNNRLLGSVQEAIDGLAALSDSPQGKTFQAAATTMLGELRRRENHVQQCEDYRRGRELGAAIANAIAAANKRSVSGAALLAGLPAEMEPALDIAVRHRLFEDLRRAVAALVAESGYPSGDAALDTAVGGTYAWEAALASSAPPPPGAKPHAVDIRAVLEQSARAQGGAFSNARVVKCLPLHGGFGKSTTLFEVEDNEGKIWPLVSRAMQDIHLLNLAGQDIGREFHIVRYAYRHGVRAAEPLWLENDKAKYGMRFFVSRQAKGRNLGTAVSAEPVSAAQAKSLATQLAKIHRLPFDASDADLAQSPIDPASGSKSLADTMDAYLQSWIDFWYSLDVGAYPAMEAAIQWLRANLPHADDVPVLLHGDYALHNILIDGDEIGGILDWEMTHVGDRAEDISWLLSTIGKHVGTREFMSYYVAAGGRPVSEFQLKYYEVLVHMKLLLVCIEAQLRFQTQPHAGPHFAILALGFIQNPLNCLQQSIAAAEAARCS